VIERQNQNSGRLSRDAFVYDADADTYTCPQGHHLAYRGMDRATRARTYGARAADCGSCPTKPGCTEGPARRVKRMVDEEARDHVRALMSTSDFARSQHLRRRIERLFGHLKRSMALRRLKLRGLSGAAEEFLVAAAAQNLKLLAGQAQPA
jgi:DDE family transposase